MFGLVRSERLSLLIRDIQDNLVGERITAIHLIWPERFGEWLSFAEL